MYVVRALYPVYGSWKGEMKQAKRSMKSLLVDRMSERANNPFFDETVSNLIKLKLPEKRAF